MPIGLVHGKEAVVNFSQMKNIDSKRLAKKVGHLEKKLFGEIMKKASRVNFS